ncbi:MAG: TetR/AcrR family transcriptional regulator [Methylotenera sp.]
MNIADKKITHAKRATYRHGDLHRTMLEAAMQMARKGGAGAIVLREVTRQAGVAPNAAYRHFADRNALLQAVSLAAQSALAIEIEEEINKISKTNNLLEAARARLRAVGTGYLRFAQAEPGLFGMAFSVPHDLSDAENPASAGETGLTPFQLLGVALDMLVEAGALTQERRLFAEIFAWSAVHGFAMLILEGPLRALDKTQTEVIGQRLIDMVERGL